MYHGACRVALPGGALTALARVGSLSELHVDGLWEFPEVRRAFRGMRKLRKLHRVTVTSLRKLLDTAASWDAASLAQLTGGEAGVDYPQGLQSLGAVGPVDESMLRSLLRLPELMELHPDWIVLRDVRPLLAGLPLLRSLTVAPLGVSPSSAGAWWMGFAAALPLCPQLTSLTLSSPALTDEHLSAILRAAPQLKSLRVTKASLVSLRCFAETPHLSHTLQELQLGRSSGCIAPAELVHLQPLHALRSLVVQCLSAPPSGELSAKPPRRSASWPRMEQVELDVAEQSS